MRGWDKTSLWVIHGLVWDQDNDVNVGKDWMIGWKLCHLRTEYSAFHGQHSTTSHEALVARLILWYRLGLVLLHFLLPCRGCSLAAVHRSYDRVVPVLRRKMRRRRKGAAIPLLLPRTGHSAVAVVGVGVALGRPDVANRNGPVGPVLVGRWQIGLVFGVTLRVVVLVQNRSWFVVVLAKHWSVGIFAIV